MINHDALNETMQEIGRYAETDVNVKVTVSYPDRDGMLVFIGELSARFQDQQVEIPETNYRCLRKLLLIKKSLAKLQVPINLRDRFELEIAEINPDWVALAALRRCSAVQANLDPLKIAWQKGDDGIAMEALKSLKGRDSSEAFKFLAKDFPPGSDIPNDFWFTDNDYFTAGFFDFGATHYLNGKGNDWRLLAEDDEGVERLLGVCPVQDEGPDPLHLKPIQEKLAQYLEEKYGSKSSSEAYSNIELALRQNGIAYTALAGPPSLKWYNQNWVGKTVVEYGMALVDTYIAYGQKREIAASKRKVRDNESGNLQLTNLASRLGQKKEEKGLNGFLR